MIIGIYCHERKLEDTLELSLRITQANFIFVKDESHLRGLLIDYDVDLLIIEDIGLVSGPQISVLRAISPQVGIMFIGQGDSSRRAELLAFCDEYISYPYAVGELQARCNALIRRMKGHSQAVIMIDRLEVDTMSRVVRWDGLPIDLTGKEYKVLECLAFRMDKVVSKEGILEYIYLANEDPPEVKIIDVFICKVRVKLVKAGAPAGLIRTQWGRGYVMEKAGPWAEKVAFGKGQKRKTWPQGQLPVGQGVVSEGEAVV